jgi:signal transduction histidine kinase
MTCLYISSNIISAIAIVVSIAGYLLNRKMLNQNKVFDEKIKAYQEILKAINHVLNTVINGLYEGQEIIKNKRTNWEDRLDELADQVDDAIDQMNDIIIVNALVLPSAVIEQLDRFSDFIDDIYVEEVLEKETKLDHLNQLLNDRFKELFNMMRNDLNADKLNHGLEKRIRGTWTDKIMSI